MLLGALGALVVFVGRMFGPNGMLIGLALALLMNGAAYFFGDKMALAAAGAKPIAPGSEPWLQEGLEELSRKAGIPTPPLYISPDPQPNAFAAGRGPGHAVVCVNAGLIQAMSRDEVFAVLAHELGHIRNRDTLTMTVAAALGATITYLAQMGFYFGGMRDDDRDGSPLGALLLFILGPIAATLIQLAVSRTREYAADRFSAELMDSAAPMINALRALERGGERIPSRTAQPTMAHLYVSAPLKGRDLMGLFSTHPPIEERVRRLAEYGR